MTQTLDIAEKTWKELTWQYKMVESNRDWRDELGMVHTTTVEGHTYKYWSDTYFKKTYAQNEQGELKAIKYNGYITNDLTVRKAIAIYFGHKTFKK